MAHSSHFDVVIIGAGIAGMTLALNLEQHISVAIFSKAVIGDGSSALAQGGVAAVLDVNDTIEAHVNDTLIAGAGLCNEEAVNHTISRSAESINQLIDYGVPFTTDDNEELHMTKEGGHSHRRILHAADATGKAMSKTLSDRVAKANNIQYFEHYTAVDLHIANKKEPSTRYCDGIYMLNQNSGKVESFNAEKVVLATGGASKVYLYTSNPDGASGDGIAMAWRAGCRVANMEFNQFHPTCLFHPHAKSSLISEAVRGEGGQLKLPNGERFMHRFDKRKELAPRDIVARAIDQEIKRLGIDCVYLDISHKGEEFVIKHFPTIHEKCLKFGIDITKEAIPVVPAAHYTCGGIVSDKHGQTDMNNLFAIGECAHTGLHGANRLASNSLLECSVYGRSAADLINQQLSLHPPKPATDTFKPMPSWDDSQVTNSDEEVIISHNWDEIRRFMWDYVGIVRTTKRLERAQHRVDLLQQEIRDYYAQFKVTNNLLELRNLATVAELIIACALKRKESRGLHYSLDYPQKMPVAMDTVLTPKG
jgi:L-aspartate oxidase